METGEWKAKILGRDIVLRKRLGSTNDLARSLAEQGAPEGTLVMAEIQTRGRGRLGRRWHSPRGGLWFSLILRPQLPTPSVARLSLVTACSVAHALRKATGAPVQVKWPNDLVLEDRKLGGILVEMGVGWVVVGVGINANVPLARLPKEVRTTAISLADFLGRPVDPTAVLQQILEELEEGYALHWKGDLQVLQRWWKELSSILGRRVRISLPHETFEGMAADINEDGSLVVRTDEGDLRHLLAGEVRVVT